MNKCTTYGKQGKPYKTCIREYVREEITFGAWTHMEGVRGGAVGWGTALQGGRSRVRFPMLSFEEDSLDIILPVALWPWVGVDSASNRNEYQKYLLRGKGGRCVGLTTLAPSCADCLEIWQPQSPGTLWACSGMQWDCFTFYTSLQLKHAHDLMSRKAHIFGLW